MLAINFILLIFNLFILSVLNKIYHQKLNHINIFSGVWLFVIVGSYFFRFENYILKNETYFVLIISWLFFLLFSFPIKKGISNPFSSVKMYNYNKLKLILIILIGLSIIAYASNLSGILSSITDIESWANQRINRAFNDTLGNNIFYTLFARTNSIIIPIAFFLFKNNKISKKYLINILVYGFLTSIIYFTRAPVLEFGVVSFISYIFIFNKQVSKKLFFKIGLLSSIFISLFVFSQSFLTNNSEGYGDVKLYLFSGVNNIQVIIEGGYADYLVYDSSYYSFDFINYILKRFDIISTYPDYVREWPIHIASNVYTYLDAFILDFGIPGALLGSAILAVVGKSLYFKILKNRSLSLIIIYSVFCYYCAMIFMNNEFIRFSFLLLSIKVIIIDYLAKNHKI